MEKIHFGNEIQRVMKRRDISVTDVAKALNLHVHSVYDMLKRENIDVYRLMELSEILNYDFFQHIRFFNQSSYDWCNVEFEGNKIVISKK